MYVKQWWSALLAHTEIDREGKTINYLFKKEAILGEEMLLRLCKSARIQPPQSWMNMPAYITSIDSVPVAKKSKSLALPFLVNHNL